MALYRDPDGAIWADAPRGNVVNVLDPSCPEDEAAIVGEAMDADLARELWGPFEPVQPVGWEAA